MRPFSAAISSKFSARALSIPSIRILPAFQDKRIQVTQMEHPKMGTIKYILEMMNAKKTQSDIATDQKASKPPTFNKTDSKKSAPNIVEDQKVTKSLKASKATTFNKALNLRKYYIGINGLSKESTDESRREFYSQFGEIASCAILFLGERKQYGSKATHLAGVRLVTQNHEKTLEAYYSRFGWLNDCWLKEANNGIGKVFFGNLKNMHLALDAQPHVIDGTKVFLQYATHDLDFFVTDMPDGITKDTLLAFYSKYGQLRECQLHKGKTGIPHAFMSYSAVNEVNRVMEDRPHIIDGKPLKIKLLGRSHFTSVPLFVGSLPESVTEETLRKEFSKFGKLVFWKVENDGRFNQSGPFGIVAYSSEQEALKALSSGPHTIAGSVVDVRKAKEVMP